MVVMPDCNTSRFERPWHYDVTTS